jgi:hypothetical protein
MHESLIDIKKNSPLLDAEYFGMVGQKKKQFHLSICLSKKISD